MVVKLRERRAAAGILYFLRIRVNKMGIHSTITSYLVKISMNQVYLARICQLFSKEIICNRPTKLTTSKLPIFLYCSKKPKERFTVPLWKSISVEGSDFDPNRPYTVFITHGFASNGNVSWVEELKDAYLKKVNNT